MLVILARSQGHDVSLLTFAAGATRHLAERPFVPRDWPCKQSRAWTYVSHNVDITALKKSTDRSGHDGPCIALHAYVRHCPAGLHCCPLPPGSPLCCRSIRFVLLILPKMPVTLRNS